MTQTEVDWVKELLTAANRLRDAGEALCNAVAAHLHKTNVAYPGIYGHANCWIEEKLQYDSLLADLWAARPTAMSERPSRPEWSAEEADAKARRFRE